MKKELVAITLILLSFSTGMILTAATSGCNGPTGQPAHAPSVDRGQPAM